MDLNDLRMFLLTARLGGLNAAARAAGVSAPTVGRRLQALEAALGRRLFDRLPGGYVLTEAGRDLLARAEPFESAVLAVERWRDLGATGRVVRISAGTWTSRFLAVNIAALWRPDDPFRVQFLSAEARLDIGRRAADIGIRNRRPDEAWLAGQRLMSENFAIYARADADARGLRGSHRRADALGGLAGARPELEVVVEASNPRMVLELVLAGAGPRCCPASSATPSRGCGG